MDDAGADIEELKREVAFLRDQIKRSEAKMLTCLVRAEAKILACQTDHAMFEDAIAKDAAKRNADRTALDDVVREEFNALWKNSRLIEHKIVEIQLFLWPIVENIFPNLLSKCNALSKRFKEPGLYSESKPR